ncbi:hypothetical protein DL546_005945 [Coniochaeta pulveracea]|uniref:Uncharacterized protein n=1 Tax=Coniochaeta pulveracea TaxID=177199 RepID=A0A420YFS0_9PEZI|nr:hypothetical protein DL546_005945 [Coniochaeta pulveracea]
MSSAENDALRRHRKELLELSSHGRGVQGTGNVLCIVNLPSPNDDDYDCNNMPIHPQYTVRIPYENFVATFPARKIEQLFRPRRLGNARKLHQKLLESLDGVDYVLDFTPPEMDDVADLVTLLWLPEDVKTWWAAGYYVPSPHMRQGAFGAKRLMADKSVGAIMTLGHDDICSCGKGDGMQEMWANTEKQLTVPGIYDGPHVPYYRKIQDYCRVRHCLGVVRLLRALSGNTDVLINSATRMWTIAQLAINMEVPDLVRGNITQWFSAMPNSKFIEMNPEVSFQLALGLKMVDVLIASFRILVAERVVELAAPARSPDLPTHTWAGRKRFSYDLSQDPVGYAAQAMCERLTTKLKGMLSMESVPVPEWEKLQYFGSVISQSASRVVQGPETELLEAYAMLANEIKSILNTYIHDALDEPAVRSNQMSDSIQAQRAHWANTESWKFPSINSLYYPLTREQRACLPFFWAHLKDVLPVYQMFEKQNSARLNLDELTNRFNLLLQKALSSGTIHLDANRLDGWLRRTTVEVLGLPERAAYFSFSQFGYEYDKEGIELIMSDHLLTNLEDSELKYLPIWAGGNDDGSGGVFQAELPEAFLGPTEPGPVYHTGYTVASDADSSTLGFNTGSASSFSDLGMNKLDLDSNDDATTVAGASNQMQYTHTTGATDPLPNTVVSMSTTSEAFTDNHDDNAYAEAKYAQPAAHKHLSQTPDRVVDGSTSEEDMDAWSFDNDDEVLDLEPDSDGDTVLDDAGEDEEDDFSLL